MQPGDRVDGLIYAGVNPLSGAPLFTTVEDWPNQDTWEGAFKTCHHLAIGGFKDWRLPSQDELQVLYDNRMAIGGFGLSLESFYWCAAPRYLRTVYWAQDFCTGICVMKKPTHQLLFRPVCGREV